MTFAVTERLNGHDVVLRASLAEELKLSSQPSAHRPCVEASSLLMPHYSKECDVFASDGGVIGESAFTRCDDVDVAECDEIGVTLAVTTVGNLGAGSLLTGHKPVEGDDQRPPPLTRELLANEQADDVTLTECRVLANAKKGGYKWRDGLLCHVEQLHGFEIV